MVHKHGIGLIEVLVVLAVLGIALLIGGGIMNGVAERQQTKEVVQGLSNLIRTAADISAARETTIEVVVVGSRVQAQRPNGSSASELQVELKGVSLSGLPLSFNRGFTVPGLITWSKGTESGVLRVSSAGGVEEQ